MCRTMQKKVFFLLHMPKLTDTQKAVLNILDFLFIQDVESIASFDQAKNELNTDVLSKIDYINSVRGDYGKKAELYKHYLLCSLELMLNLPFEVKVSINEEGLNKSKFVLDEIINGVLKNSFYEDEFLDDINRLFKNYEGLSLDRGTVYKLVRQALYFDYDNVSIVAYKRLLDLGILHTENYKLGKSTIDKKYLEDAFFRSMLFIEFEIVKRQYDDFNHFKNNRIGVDLKSSLEEMERIFALIRRVKRSMSNDGFGAILKVDINNKKEIEKYIVGLSQALGHETLFFKNIPACIGLIGCWFLIHAKETVLERPTYYDFFDEDLNSSSRKLPCDNIARAEILKYGFELQKRTLHSRYIDFYKFYDMIRSALNF